MPSDVELNLNNRTIEDELVELIRRAATRLPSDVKDALRAAFESEEDDIGRVSLGAIMRSIEISESEGLPICQDTGSITFYVKGGCEVNRLRGLLFRVTARATSEIPLRPNMVNPFTAENPGNNLGILSPFILWEPTENKGSIEVTVLLKGAGSDNMTALGMLNPSEGIDGIEKFTLKNIIEAGGKPCPPTIVGVGIGGSSDIAVLLSKKALLRPIGLRNPDVYAAELEKRLLEKINGTKIGPMGLGGKWTSLWVNVEYAHRHIASLPVAISMSCWALRRASLVITGSEILEIERTEKERGD